MSGDLGEAAKRVKAAWDDAEDKLKRTERVKGNLTIPAVNELRYAGYHVIEGLASADPNETAQHFQKAEKHCKRAGYDAVEAEVLFHATQYRQFQQDYRTISITLPGLDYISIRVRTRTAMDLVMEARRNEESRDQYYTRVVPHCDQLRADLDVLTEARDELNKLVHAQEAAKTAAAEEKAAEAEVSRAALQREATKSAAEAKRWKLGLVVAALLAAGGWGVTWFKDANAAAAPPALPTKP